MLVKELIANLEQFDPTFPVYIEYSETVDHGDYGISIDITREVNHLYEGAEKIKRKWQKTVVLKNL